MKFTKLNIIENIKRGNLKALLIYGPDNGMISILERNIAEALSFSRDSYDYSDLDIASFHSLLKTRDLFAQNQIVKISNVPQSIPADIKKILSGNLAKFVVFTADDLQKNSSMRKFFESENDLAIVPCYVEDANVVAQTLRLKIAKAGKKISNDAASYLASALIGDSLYAENEIEKLLIFCDDKNDITFEDVEAIISSEISTSPDKLCIAFASDDKKTYLHELTKLLEENISPIWIIRALIRYYLNMYFVSRKLKDGMMFDIAINSVVPPIFFKYLPDFKKNIAKNNIDRIQEVLTKLHDTEKQCKTTSADQRFLCESLIFSVSLHPTPFFSSNC